MNAQSACAVDTNCQAVEDYSCDDSGVFVLCNQSSNFYSSYFSCAYTKGKWLFEYKYIFNDIVSGIILLFATL